MGAGGNYNVGHADDLEGGVEIFGETGLVADEIAETEVGGGAGDVSSNKTSKPELELGGKISWGSA